MKPKLSIKFKIGEDIFEPNYMAELEVARETINKNLTEQASYFAWYAVLSEMAEAEFKAAKLELELTEAELDSTLRKNKKEIGEKFTEGSLGAEIKSDEKYVVAMLRMNEWHKNMGIVKAIKEAFAQRKDVLISLSSNMRAERDVEIMIKKSEHEKEIG